MVLVKYLFYCFFVVGGNSLSIFQNFTTIVILDFIIFQNGFPFTLLYYRNTSSFSHAKALQRNALS